jgi:hypothetical protein
MITSRLLPPEEWSKLQAIVPYFAAGTPSPDHWLMPVVEEDGQIIASCALFDTTHWDVFNILPAYQKNPAVIRHLLDVSLQTMRDLGIPSVHLTIPDDQPALIEMAEQFGFVKSPFALYLCAIPPKDPE